MEVNTTENKTLEQDYRDLAGLLSNIVDSLPIYFFVKDTGDNFRYVYSSPLMNQLYGRYHNDVVGKTDLPISRSGRRPIFQGYGRGGGENG